MLIVTSCQVNTHTHTHAHLGWQSASIQSSAQMPVYLFLLAYPIKQILTFTLPHGYFNRCLQPPQRFTPEDLGTLLGICLEFIVNRSKNTKRKLPAVAPFHSVSSAVSVSNGPLVVLNFYDSRDAREKPLRSEPERWTGMGLQKSRYLHASLTSFQSALSSVFVTFGSVESSRCFIFPSGHLTSPPEGISMCEQAQKKKGKEMRCMCECVASRSSLDFLWKRFGNHTHWLWNPVRFRKSKSQTHSSVECLDHNHCKEEEREKLWLKFEGLDEDGPWSHDHSTAATEILHGLVGVGILAL